MSDSPSVFDFLQNRILTHYPAARMILEGQMPAPRTAIVYPTYVCNQNCLWCEYAEDNRTIHEIMPGDKLRQLLRDLYDLGVRGVEFCGGGEPTLHPELPAVIREMKEMGLSVGLLTNGTRLSGELAQAIVDCGSYVRIGFDSSNADTFSRLKRPKVAAAGFDCVCENVRDLVKLRNSSGTWVLISMKVILSQENYTEVGDCVALARRLQVDSIQFKAARVCDSELTPEQCVSVKQQMKAAAEKYPEMKVVGGVDKYDMKEQCWLSPLQIMVDTLGDVFLCCYYRQRKEAHTIGNCFETPLRDLWYSERHWEAIRNIKPTECSLLDCRFVRYNETMTDLLVNHDAQFEFI